MTKIVATLGLAAVLLGPAAVTPARADHYFRNPDCYGQQAANTRHTTGVADAAGDVRVYAIQFKQDLQWVPTYRSYAFKMDCLISEFVMPTADQDWDNKADHPTVVVLNEDAGLSTLGTGTQGLGARAVAAHGPKDPSSLAGTIGAFGAVGAGYARQEAYYAAKFPGTSPQRLILAAATDTFARGFMETNSELARKYGVYIVSANNQAEYRETLDAAALAALADPDIAGSYALGDVKTVFEAVDRPGSSGRGRDGVDVYNQAFMWAPTDDVTPYAHARFDALNGAPLTAADARSNIVAVNAKTPITPIEQSLLDLSDDEDMSAANTGPFGLLPADDPSGKIKIGFGISLPAFMWGSDFGVAAPGAPCARPVTWMRCLDARGVNVFLQPEANPGMWADYIDTSWRPTSFQALSWLNSAWRAVADPTVHNIRYAITPHMVGNLVDLTFDGQSVIFERCLARGASDTCAGNVARTFVGARDFIGCGPGVTDHCDDPKLARYSGDKRETMAMAPWVLDDLAPGSDPVANRARLAERSQAMQAGTGSPYENGYLETAIYADLDLD